MVDQGFTIKEREFPIIIRTGTAEHLDWFNQRFPVVDAPIIWNTVVRAENKWEIIRWLESHIGKSPYAFGAAAKVKKIKLLQYFADNNYPKDPVAFTMAASPIILTRGQLGDVHKSHFLIGLQWLKDNNFPWTIDACKAIKSKVIAQWFKENNCPCGGTLHKINLI